MTIDYKFDSAKESAQQYVARTSSAIAAANPTDPNAARLAPPATGTPAPAPAPSSTTPATSDYYPRYSSNEQQASDYLDTFTPEKSVEAIQAEKTTAAKGQIDSLNTYYDNLINEQNTINQGRDRSTNAVSVLNGLSGSTDALNAANDTTKLNQRDNDKINAERSAAVQSILSEIRSSAADEAKQSRLDAKSSAESILARRTQKQTESLDHIKTLAMAGTTSDGLKSTDPVAYQHLADMAGGEEQLKAIFTLNRPQETILDKRVEGGKYVIAYQNPLTGKVRMESVDLGLPVGYTKSFDLGDHLAFAPDNWDGNPDKLISVSKGLSPDQKDQSARGWAQIAIDKQKANNDSGYTVDENGNVIQTGDFDALTIGRYNKAANSATAILQKNPTFKNIIGSSAYLDRIEAAVQNPGSVGDQELLDAFTQLNTGGNRVTEAQVHLITNNQSVGDLLQKYKQKLTTGGALSGDQRSQIVQLAHEVYKNYQKSYQPLYDDATKRLGAQGIPKQFWNIPDPKTLSRSVSDGSGTQGPNIVTAPDGTQIEIVDEK